MKKYIILVACLSLLVFSCDDDKDNGSIGPVSNPSSQPYIGGVTLTWTDPSEPDYYCTLVSYQNAAGETVKKKISHYESKEGVTTTTIIGFEDTDTYTFTLTAYNADGATSAPVTVTGTPQDASMAYYYIVNTVTSTPGFQGATIHWENEYLVPSYINISYADVMGTQISKQYDASTSGSVTLGGIMAETPVTITTENRNGDKSEEQVFMVSPAEVRGELSQSQMSIAGISSVWQAGSEGENMLDGDVYTYWHAKTDAGLWPHWFTVDLGGDYMVDWVELVRRQYEDGNGLAAPTQIQLQYSLDGENFTDLGTYDLDIQYVYGHTFNFKEVYARYIKVLCLSGSQPWTHMAEFLAYYGSANKYTTEAAAERTPSEPDEDDTDEIFEDQFEYFTFNTGAIQQMEITQSEENKYEYSVLTTGGDAFVTVNGFAQKVAGPILVFRYKASVAFEGEFFWIDAGGGAAGGRSTKFYIPANATGEWKTFKVNLADAMGTHNWVGNIGDFVRFDFGASADIAVDIKNIHFRALRDSELGE